MRTVDHLDKQKQKRIERVVSFSLSFPQTEAFPTVVLTHPRRTVLMRILGYRDAETLLRLIRVALKKAK